MRNINLKIPTCPCRWLWALAATVLLGACDLIDYHPYDVRISGETGLTEKNIRLIEERCRGRQTFRFAVISDTQRLYDDTRDEVDAINRRGDIDFVIHCGDQSDFGATHEFEWMRDIFQKLRMPYVCIIGNHDRLGTGDDAYKKIYGAENFTFTAGDVRFVCLNTNALEYDYSHAIPDFTFMRDVLEDPASTATKTIVAMHAGPKSEQFNNNVEYVFHDFIKRYPQLQFCIFGHGHTTEVDDLFGDGVLYYECGNAAKRQYLVFTIQPEAHAYDYEVADF